MAISIGAAAEDRASTTTYGSTLLDLANPANESGTIDTIEIWCATNLSGCKVGTLYLISGTTYKCRAVVTIGNVTAGSKQTFSSLSLACVEGDVIGIYYSAGTLDRTNSGGTSAAYSGIDCLVVNEENEFTAGERIYSVHGLSTASPPTVTAISPTYGTTAGGTSVTITGTNFTGASGATIGGHAVTDFSVVSATSITGTTPADTVGAKDVVVTNGGLTGTLTGGFFYITPVTNVSTVDKVLSTAGYAVRIPFQSKIWVAAGRTWAFYENAGSIYFKSTTTGVFPVTAGTLIADGYKDFEFASYWDGTNVTIVYAKQSGAELPIYYRRGTPQAGGTITWDDDAVSIYTPAVNYDIADLNVAVNTDGYAFIAFEAQGATNYPHVIKNADNDGTWTLDTDTTLDAVGSENSYTATVVALTSNKVYVTYAVMYGTFSQTIKGRLWNSSWGSEETASTLYLENAFFDMWTTVAIGDDVHLIFNEETSNDLTYVKRTYGVGWGSATTVQASTSTTTCPVICANGTNLAVFWLDTVKLYVKNCISGVWDTNPTTVADETANGIFSAGDINATVNATANVFGILYDIEADTPWFVRYASYTAPTATTRSQTVAMDALLRATDTKTATLDTLLQFLADSKTVSIDTLLRLTGIAQTIDLDARLRDTSNQTVALDALLRELGITQTVALDILIRSLGVTQTVALDMLLQLGGVTQTVSLDTLLKFVGETQTLSIDAIFQLGGIQLVDLDARFRATDTKTASLDTRFIATDSRAVSLDTLLRTLGISSTVALDALLRSGGLQSVSLDVLLKTLNIPLSVALDAIFGSGFGSATVALDTLLKGQSTGTISLDAILKSIGISRTVALDALITARTITTLSLDALIKALGVSRSVALDTILKGAGVETITLDVLFGSPSHILNIGPSKLASRNFGGSRLASRDIGGSKGS